MRTVAFGVWGSWSQVFAVTCGAPRKVLRALEQMLLLSSESLDVPSPLLTMIALDSVTLVVTFDGRELRRSAMRWAVKARDELACLAVRVRVRWARHRCRR